MVNFITYDRTHGLLFPPDLCDWVGDDDLVHFIIEAEAADQEDAADPQALPAEIARRLRRNAKSISPIRPIRTASRCASHGAMKFARPITPNPDAKTKYKRRKYTVEPVFGSIKNVLGFNRFSLRGLEKVKTEWLLVATAKNNR